MPSHSSRYAVRQIAAVPLLAMLLSLGGCDIPGMGPDPRIAQREADARAIGSACRFSIRGIEDCYALNDKASKAQIFAGWKDMDQYMRDNKIEGIPGSTRQAGAGSKLTDDIGETADAEAAIDKTSEKVIKVTPANQRKPARPVPM